MDYGQAQCLMDEHTRRIHKGGGFLRGLNQNAKKLKNETWLLRGAQSTGGLVYVLELFKKPILHFYPDRVELNDHGYFSRTTHDRFNEYLPRGFRVWGQYIPWLKRTLGFVKTPVGVFPYNMPLRFSYDGSCLDSLHADAASVVEKIPEYVEDYLSALFSKRMSTAWVDHVVGDYVLHDVKHASLILNCTPTRASADPMHGGMNINDVVRILVEEGINAFKEARGRVQRAHRLELALKHGRGLPIIHASKLRKQLRHALREYLIDHMAFDHVEWHRR